MLVSVESLLKFYLMPRMTLDTDCLSQGENMIIAFLFYLVVKRKHCQHANAH